jgi:hypothetical protein
VSFPNLASQKQYAEYVPRQRYDRSGDASVRSDGDSFTEHRKFSCSKCLCLFTISF